MMVATTWQTSSAVRVARRLTGRKCWLQFRSLSTALSSSGRRMVETLSRSQVRRPVMLTSMSALMGFGGVGREVPALIIHGHRGIGGEGDEEAVIGRIEALGQIRHSGGGVRR